MRPFLEHRAGRFGRFALAVALLYGCGSRSWLGFDDGSGSDDAPPSDSSLGDALADGSEDGGDDGDVMLDAGLDSIPLGCGILTCANGCCAKDGACSPPNTCGSYGEACETCAADEICKGGVCFRVIEGGYCNPSNCAGCCWWNGTACASGIHARACGRNGEACVLCIPSQGTAHCEALPEGGGHCTHAPPPCSGLTCKGCCTKTGICAVGAQDFACGTGGAACEDCAFVGSQCSGGTCKK